MKLLHDFGVTALWGTIVITGIITILVYAMWNGKVAEAGTLSGVLVAIFNKVYDAYMSKRKDDLLVNHNGNGVK